MQLIEFISTTRRELLSVKLSEHSMQIAQIFKSH